MATLESAKMKYRAKIPQMSSAYNEGMGAFLGIGPGAVASSIPGRSYSMAISSGVEEKWANNLRRAFGA